MSSKNRRSASVQVEYVIHIQEIKPWPPSQSLRSLRSVLIHWENGARNSGSTNAVIPSIGSLVGEGKIEFNESFRLPVILQRDNSSRAKDVNTFQRNCLEFNLYEPRRDKSQLLATAVIDLADYGIIKEAIVITVSMSSKRILTNTSQPVLYVEIHPAYKSRSSTASRSDPSRNGSGSVSAPMNEEYAEEAESALFTDDDVSFHSSLANAILSHPIEVNGSDFAQRNGGTGGDNITASKSENGKLIVSKDNSKGCSHSSSVDFSSDIGSPVNAHGSLLNSPLSSSLSVSDMEVTPDVHSLSSIANGNKERCNVITSNNNPQNLRQSSQGGDTNSTILIQSHTQQSAREVDHLGDKIASFDNESAVCEDLASTRSSDFVANEEDNNEAHIFCKKSLEESSTKNNAYARTEEDVTKSRDLGEERLPLEDHSHGASNCPTQVTRTHFSGEVVGTYENKAKVDRVKHVKSVRSSVDSVRGNGSASRNQQEEMKDVCSPGVAQNRSGSLTSNDRTSSFCSPNSGNTLDSKIQHLEQKIKMLEGELREAAAIEVALYSVVAEHGSSISKVHAPARRLSRLYLHACRENSQPRKASAARSAVSGIVLVAKACGNDVPRLTFWLSNTVMLRAIVSRAIDVTELPRSPAPHIETNGGDKRSKKLSSPLIWKEISASKNKNKISELHDWEDPQTFISTLEKVEAWIFSRIVESIWWQTLTPHMQSAATKAIDSPLSSGSKMNLPKTSDLGDQDQADISLDLWKYAFKDACERLCPVRAGGHKCGCLRMLARLIMEQCVARLDVAMFNAILREPADEIPTDPVSDPISDSKVLPIPAGKSSFGAGAQLKTAIGNWSRWLTDLFGMDVIDSHDDKDGIVEDDECANASFQSFHLLNALSDLMMLPKDMLLTRSVRKEVCPTFGAPLIKKILHNFESDEFCPDPIPDNVLDALDSEDVLETGEDSISTIPCIAAPAIYQLPSASSLANIVGDFSTQSHLQRSGSSVLRKSYTSDDELDELNSPLAAILHEDPQSSAAPMNPGWKSNETGSQRAVRYQLLRAVWMDNA